MQHPYVIKVEKVKFGPDQLSKETLNVVADVYINGTKVGYVYNDGNGSPTFLQNLCDKTGHSIEGALELCNEADAYFRALPEVERKIEGYNKTYMSGTSLIDEIDIIIYDLYNKKENEKLAKSFAKKLEKNCKVAICYGTNEDYQMVSWTYKNSKEKIPLEVMMANIKLKSQLEEKVASIKANLPRGHVILNKNL